MYLRSRPSAPLVVAAISTISSDEGGGGGSHSSATDMINASPAAGNPAWTRSSSADSAHFEPSYPISSFIFHLRLRRHCRALTKFSQFSANFIPTHSPAENNDTSNAHGRLARK